MSEVVEAVMRFDEDGQIVGKFYTQIGSSVEIRFQSRAHADRYIEGLEPEKVLWENLQ